MKKCDFEKYNLLEEKQDPHQGQPKEVEEDKVQKEQFLLKNPTETESCVKRSLSKFEKRPDTEKFCTLKKKSNDGYCHESRKACFE